MLPADLAHVPGGRRRRVLRRLAMLVPIAAASVLASAAAEDRITVLEGDARIVDGARAFAAAPGVKLAAGAIVDTGERTAMLRIESDDGGIVDLGPSTRVMLAPRGVAARDRKTPVLYLLSGWVKQAAGAAETSGLVTPAIDLLPFAGTMVVHASADGTQVFAESGRARLVERRARGLAPLPLAAGEQYAAKPGEAGATLPRPTHEFVAALPRLFRDRIPPRAAKFKGAEVEPAPLPAPDYASLAPWLAAEPAIRRDFPRRFRALARGAFRAALEKGLAAHPEWRPVLYPPPPTKDR